MAELWTFLGGNRGRIRRQDSHLQILGSLATYRREARDRVTQTIDELTRLQEDLEELRGRIAQPWISTLNPTVHTNDGMAKGWAGGIPIEVHMESIRKGVRRLGLFRQRGLQG